MLLASFLFLTACKKGDVVCTGCYKPPTCLPNTLWEEVEFFELRTIVHFSLYTSGNIPSSLVPSYTPPGGRELNLRYAGNYLYMIDNKYQPDTVLVAKLDNCKRPLTSRYNDTHNYISFTSTYAYNIKGQLTKITINGAVPDVINYAYDHRGNVTSITSNRMKHFFKYDYSRPFTKGVLYNYNFIHDDILHMAPHSFFEWIGHIDLTPGNLRITSELWVDNVLRDKKSYDDYQFQDGNVSGYTGHDLLSVPNRKHFYRLLWNCSLTADK